jgi:hypothetical protein
MAALHRNPIASTAEWRFVVGTSLFQAAGLVVVAALEAGS